jgi:two-component system, OmpR family, response regulator
MDGLKVLAALRRRGALVPVFVLSAQGQVANRIKALDLGADDCLVKPFAFEELLARVRASLRTRASILAGQLVTNDIRLDPRRREANVGDRR